MKPLHMTDYPKNAVILADLVPHTLHQGIHYPAQFMVF